MIFLINKKHKKSNPKTANYQKYKNVINQF